MTGGAGAGESVKKRGFQGFSLWDPGVSGYVEDAGSGLRPGTKRHPGAGRDPASEALSATVFPLQKNHPQTVTAVTGALWVSAKAVYAEPMTDIIHAHGIETRILHLRGQKVLLDADLAELYGVTTSALNQAVKRNISRFPEDFMFQLTRDEGRNLKSQIVISSLRSVTENHESGWGGKRSQSFAFTEHGVAMLSSVLSSERATQVNIAIIRAFTRLREFLATHQDLAKKLEELEAKYDDQFREVFEAIWALMEVKEEKEGRRMGFIRE
jgi:phage regulator Rha-like protein